MFFFFADLKKILENLDKKFKNPGLLFKQGYLSICNIDLHKRKAQS